MKIISAILLCLFFTVAGWAQLPTIRGVTVSNITATSAMVSWNTSSVTNAMVGWGPVGGLYGGIEGGNSGVFDSGGATRHSYTIKGLHPSTIYNFFLRSSPDPNGVLDANQTHWAVWDPDGCSGTCAFTTSAAPAGGFDYYIYMTGPNDVVQGYDTYMAAWLAPLVGSYAANSLTITVTGLPPYTSLQWTKKQQYSIGADAVEGNSLTLYDFANKNANGYDIHLTTNVGGSTPKGSYTLTVTGSGSGIPTHRATWTLNVNPPGTGFTAGVPGSYPAIPCLAANSTLLGGGACPYDWTDTMSTYGQFWTPEDTDFTEIATTPACAYPAPRKKWPARCIRANDPSTILNGSAGIQTQAWFYDGDLVFEQIGNYLGNPEEWDQGVTNVNRSYRDNYVIPNSGKIPGYMIFTEGLYRDYLANGTAVDLTAIDDLATKSAEAITPGGQFSKTTYQREAAYTLEAHLWASKLDNPTISGQPASYWLQYDVAHVLGMIDQECNQNQPFEYFMTGLQAEALIKYYINTGSGDVRIPAAVEQLANCVWPAWGVTADDPYAFPYASAYAAYGFSRAGTGGSSGETLNLLVAPMYAWLYSMTGNRKYQVEGDTIFQYGVTMPTSGGIPATLGYTGNGGKQFSQNYRWSFDYVQWRNQSK